MKQIVSMYERRLYLVCGYEYDGKYHGDPLAHLNIFQLGIKLLPDVTPAFLPCSAYYIKNHLNKNPTYLVFGGHLPRNQAKDIF